MRREAARRRTRTAQGHHRTPLELACYEAPRASLTQAALANYEGVEDSPIVCAVTNRPVAVGTGLIRCRVQGDAEPRGQEPEEAIMTEILPPPQGSGGRKRPVVVGGGEEAAAAAATTMAPPRRPWRGPGIVIHSEGSPR